MTKNIDNLMSRLPGYQLRSRDILPLEAVYAEHTIIYNGIDHTKPTYPSPLSISIISDKATRMPAGIGIAAGFAPLRSFLRALKYMLSPEREPDNNWPVGLPYIIYVDRGDRLTSESLSSIVQHLHIQIRNGQPIQSTLTRKVRKQLTTIGPTLLDIKSIKHLLFVCVNEHYVHNYQEELGDTPMNLWQKELKAGWEPVIPPADKVREALSQLGDEDN